MKRLIILKVTLLILLFFLYYSFTTISSVNASTDSTESIATQKDCAIPDNPASQSPYMFKLHSYLNDITKKANCADKSRPLETVIKDDIAAKLISEMNKDLGNKISDEYKQART
ncbi:MAG: hypothetical protein HQK51_21520, partial [Oligoflexia bacterium]|nr:hypothetical protein [Oligoflexia bacterium]